MKKALSSMSKFRINPAVLQLLYRVPGNGGRGARGRRAAAVDAGGGCRECHGTDRTCAWPTQRARGITLCGPSGGVAHPHPTTRCGVNLFAQATCGTLLWHAP